MTNFKKLNLLLESKLENLLDVDQIPRSYFTKFYDAVDEIKFSMETAETLPQIKNKTVLFLFFEKSTRTQISFKIAATLLGLNIVDIETESLSISKGESLLQTISTVESINPSVIIMRTPNSGAPYYLKRSIKTSIINAGDGLHAHPTQALLDNYTMSRNLIDKLDKVFVIGDVLHSRVARSNAVMGMRQFVSPNVLTPVLNKDFEILHSLDDLADDTQLMYGLRLQRERFNSQQQGLLNLRDYAENFQLTNQTLPNKSCKVMHPGPINPGLDVAPELANSQNSLMDEQVSNGVAVRVTLLYWILKSQNE